MASEQEAFDEENEEYELEDVGEDGAYARAQSELSRQVEEEDDKEEEMSALDEKSDDPEQKRRYMEYLSLIKEIECQNKMIEDIKTRIMELCVKPCKTRCETKEIKRLRCCMEQENLKLQCMMSKAIQLQNYGSRRRYHEIPIATTIDEDNLSPYAGTIPQPTWKTEDECDEKQSSSQDQRGERDADRDKQLKSLCQAMGKMKICCPEDKKLVQEIAAALMCNSKRSKKPDSSDKNKKQKQLQAALRKCARTLQQSQQPAQSQSLPDYNGGGGGMGADNLEKLKQRIACMQLSVNKLKQEICKREQQREKEKECQEEADPTILCTSKRNTKQDQIEKLKENYLYLLSEYAKKDCQLKEMEMRMKGFCGGCGGNGKNQLKDVDDSELQLLRSRVNEMKEEQVEFKCIMKEQSQQLEDYRNKYLAAQQKVEEQSVTLDKLNMNNKRIEKQINTEVKEIRAKFQEKLNELLHFPKLLENEQLKLANTCKEKEELQSKLHLVCKELQSLKNQIEGPKDDCRPQLNKCQIDLAQAQQKIEELERQRDMFCEQLKTTQEDLDTLRSESAKIIARTKERAELTRQQQQEQIDRLEKELAQCRATACLSVSDRESVIREMQGQLNTLSYSFDAAQKQIKTLRNHIAYVSNENCFPVKC